jgi:hypothetical protein
LIGIVKTRFVFGREQALFVALHYSGCCGKACCAAASDQALDNHGIAVPFFAS